MRSACKNLKERAVLEMLISSGVRVEELSNIDLSDIDFGSLSIHVRNGKGGKDRVTYTTEVASTHVKKYVLGRKEQGNVLIYNKNHERISTQGIRSILKTIGKRAGVENVHPHRFRRTFATGLASRGMEVHEIQRLMGHSNINTTMIYIYTDDQNVASDYRKFAV